MKMNRGSALDRGSGSLRSGIGNREGNGEGKPLSLPLPCTAPDRGGRGLRCGKAVRLAGRAPADVAVDSTACSDLQQLARRPATMSSTIESVLTESRVFPPSAEMVRQANISGMDA